MSYHVIEPRWTRRQDEMYAALRRVFEIGPGQPCAVAGPEPIAAPKRVVVEPARRAVWPLLAAIALVVIAGAWLLRWEWRHAELERRLAGLQADVGWLALQSGEVDLARRLLDGARATLQPVQDQEPRPMARALAGLAAVARVRDDAIGAEALARRALSVLQVDPEPCTEAALATRVLGGALLDQRRLAEAEPLLLAALRIHRELLGDDHDETRASRAEAVALYVAWGREEDAVRLRHPSAQKRAH